MSGTFQGRIAFASIGGSGVNVDFNNQSGDFESVENPEAGVFNFTLKAPIDPSEAVYLATTTNKDGQRAQVWRAACTDTLINVRTFSTGGLAQDCEFDLVVLVKPIQ